MSSLERLWAGWRSEYIASVVDSGPGGQEEAVGDGTAGPEAHCVFCRILASGVPDLETHVVWRDRAGLTVAILNAYPYSTGHLLVMPVRHVGDLEDLEPGEAAALWDGVTRAVVAVKAAYRPDGLNVGANLGRAAGAGVPGHLHLHVLPRWGGDSNFMTSVAETRVLPEALSVSAAKIGAAWPGRATGERRATDERSERPTVW